LQGGYRYLHDQGQKELYNLTAVVELLHMGDFLAFSNYPQVRRMAARRGRA
jgi:hypothetical protein